MAYLFDVDTFIESFNAKTSESKSTDSMRLTHRADNHFKLFPYKASGKTQAPIVTDLEDVVSGFFRCVLNKKTETVKFDELCNALMEEVDVDDDDVDYFKDLIQSIFFKGKDFVANNIGLYPYQTQTNNKSADNLAKFLYSVLGISKQDCEKIEKAKEGYRFNVLEDMVINTIEAKKVSEAGENVPYYLIKDDIQKLFREDFYFMIETGMTTLDDLANLFAVYYFFYVSQVCIVLDHFCSGKRNDKVHLYYALDWEKVSKNRLCCVEGWDKLQGSISHMFSHAITLEILNQTVEKNMMDYIAFGQMVYDDSKLDIEVADEIEKAEDTYCSYVGDYKDFNNIPVQQGASRTEEAIRHLYKCVEAQFLNTERKRANQFYNEKFSEFCKSRWVKE